MLLSVVNNTGSTISLLSGNVSIPANSTTAVTNTTYQYQLATDGFTRQNVVEGSLSISDGTNTFGSTDAIGYLYLLLQALGPICDGSGNQITSTTVGSKQSLDTNVSQMETTVDKIGSGSIGALNAAVIASTNGCSAVVFTVVGTWAGVLQLEGSVDNTNWVDLNGVILPAGQAQSTLSSNETISVPCGGFQSVRLIATNYSSGTANITWDASSGQNVVQVINAAYSNLNVTAYQPAAGDLFATAYVNDGSGNAIDSINSQLQTADVINTAITSGSVTVSTTAVAARVSTSNLANRKMLIIAPITGIVYLGATSSVTTATGIPIFPNTIASFAFSTNVTPYLIAAASTTVDVMEGS
jgi:hypothetical protein